MGLGLFIAKTLLERSGAELSFANGREEPSAQGVGVGAVVEVKWLRRQIDAVAGDRPVTKGANQRFAV